MKAGDSGVVEEARQVDAPRAWTFAARLFLALAFTGWVSLVAGQANQQELLANTAAANVSLADPGPLLDRIASFALLHDATYFAKYASKLDPRDPRAFNKFWWLASLEAAGLLIGLAGTLWDRGAGRPRYPTARILASAILALSQTPDGPEAAVEVLSNYSRLGVRLPAYRVAEVIGSAVVPLANLGAAMVLGWDPARPYGPDVTAVVVPDARTRGVPAWQAWLERTYLGTVDAVRRPALVTLAAAQWACTAVGWAGYGVGVASGQWWRTHIPLCGIALAVQVLANLALAAALDPRTQGRAGGTAQAAQGTSLLLGIWRINRSWAAGVTLVAVRTGVKPPPGYILFNAGVIAWIGCVAFVMTLLGTRAAQPGDVDFRGTPYRAVAFFIGGPVGLAGVLLLTISTMLSSNDEKERRMWAGETYFSQSGDRWWLMYTIVVYYVIAVKPFFDGSPMVFVRSREATMYGKLTVALGTNYMVNKSTSVPVNAGLWLICGGFVLEACMGALANDSRGGARAWRALASPCAGSRRRAPARPGGVRGFPGLALVASAAGAGDDPEAGGSGDARHTVRLLVPSSSSSSASSGSAQSGGRPPPRGRRADDVVLERLIGTGSFSSVFKATYAGAPVAVKVLSAASQAAQAAAREEARLALSLRHPCVLQTFAILEVEVDGPTLLASTTTSSGSNGLGTGAAPPQPSALASAALAEFATILQPPRPGVRGGGGGGDDDGGAAALPPTDGGGTSSASASASVRRQSWLIQELCDRGTLDRAIRNGVFRRDGGGSEYVGAPSRASSGGGRGGRGSQPSTEWAPAKDGAASGAAAPPPGPATATAALLATLHDVASALAYLHRFGIIHGDLKPANILLRSRAKDRAGRRVSACVADFGLSRILGVGPASTPSHLHTHTFGTVAYSAPELMKEGRLARAADCYALGMVAWEIWAGVPPHAGVPPASIFYTVGIEGRRPSLDGFESAPPGYVDLMTALWADAMHERPTAAEAARRLKAMLDAELAKGSSSPPPSPRRPATPRP